MIYSFILKRIHSGDFSKKLSMERFEKEITDFNDFFGKLPHSKKVNHFKILT
jgi:hypothetical protein